MILEIDGIEQLTAAMQNVAVQIGDRKTKRNVLRKAGNVVRDAARSIAPKMKRKGQRLESGGYGHVRYDTPKISNKLKAPKGMGVRIAEFVKGNLSGAIRILSLRRTANIIVGPKVSKRGSSKGKFGPGTRRFDAYYAQMVFGSAKAFQRRVMIRALQQSSAQATNLIGREVEKEIKKAARQNRLDVR